MSRVINSPCNISSSSIEGYPCIQLHQISLHDICNVYIDVFNVNYTRLLKYMSSLEMHGAYKDIKFIIKSVQLCFTQKLFLDHNIK